MTDETVPAVIPEKKHSLVTKFADKFGVDPNKMLSTLKATAFKASGEISNEQMMALIIVADQYDLNPWTKEIFAFPDSRNGIVPVVSVDGWTRIINSHSQFDGVEFIDGPTEKSVVPEWIECVIYRKDRSHPTRIRERFQEVRRDTAPWKSHPSRMLRHKALIQCARIAFGFAGIYDEDEAARIREVDVTPIVVTPPPPEPAPSKAAALVGKLKKKPAGVVMDAETGEVMPPEEAPPPEQKAEAEKPPVITFDAALKIVKGTKFLDVAQQTLDLASTCIEEAQVDKLADIINRRVEAGELQ